MIARTVIGLVLGAALLLMPGVAAGALRIEDVGLQGWLPSASTVYVALAVLASALTVSNLARGGDQV